MNLRLNIAEYSGLLGILDGTAALGQTTTSPVTLSMSGYGLAVFAAVNYSTGISAATSAPFTVITYTGSVHTVYLVAGLILTNYPNNIVLTQTISPSVNCIIAAAAFY
jgi:hypothetical protein